MGSLRTFAFSGLLSLSLVMAAGAQPTSQHSASMHLVDLSEDNWCHDCVVKMVDTFGIMTGYDDNTFRGDWKVDRYELAAAVAKSYNQLRLFYKLNLPEAGTRQRVNLSADHWAAPYVRKLAQENGLLSKLFTNGDFHGERTLTRQELAYSLSEFLQQMEKQMGQTLSLPRRQSQLASDLDPRSAYLPYIEKALNRYQFMNLTRDNAFRPDAPVTRYELAAALCKAFALFDIEEKMAARQPAPSSENMTSDESTPVREQAAGR